MSATSTAALFVSGEFSIVRPRARRRMRIKKGEILRGLGLGLALAMVAVTGMVVGSELVGPQLFAYMLAL